jgi:SAM-dependent methyltransferase
VLGFDILECERCGHRRVELPSDSKAIEAVFGDHYFFGGDVGYRDYLSEEGLIRDHGIWYARLLRKHMRPGRLLDVGAAAGFIAEGLMSEGWEVVGLEPNRTMTGRANERLGEVVRNGVLEEWGGTDRFDVVVMIQVISHLRDLRRALGAAAAATKDGGYWIVETWNRRSLTARAFGWRWHEYSPPSVGHWFTPEGLAQLAGRFGFEEVARGRPPKSLSVGHARALLECKLGAGPARALALGLLGVLPDRLGIPYPGDDLFWMLLRKVDAVPRSS